MSLVALPLDIFTMIMRIAHDMEDSVIIQLQSLFRGRRVRYDMSATRSGVNRPLSAIAQELETRRSRRRNRTVRGLFG